MIKKIEKWQTSDGNTFDTAEEAAKHERSCMPPVDSIRDFCEGTFEAPFNTREDEQDWPKFQEQLDALVEHLNKTYHITRKGG